MAKLPWYAQPETRKRPPDIRHPEEHAAVAAALERLPPDHRARAAYAEGLDTIALTHLVADRPELVVALTEAFLAGYRRSLERWGSHFRPCF